MAPNLMNGALVAGRPPWYASDGQLHRPAAFVIGIAGGSASGKTSVALYFYSIKSILSHRRIIHDLNVPWIVHLSMDSFYRSLDAESLERATKNEYNFDHPDAFDFACLYDTLERLKAGQRVSVPVYDFTTHTRSSKTTEIYGASVIVFEGIFALYDRRVRDLMDLKLFVDTDSDTRLARRLRRDVSERGRDVVGVLAQYNKYVKPAFDEYIYPTMRFADVIIPRGVDNVVAIELISKHAVRLLEEKGLSFRATLAILHENKMAYPSSLILLPQTNQLKAIETIIRDGTTSRDDFIFFADRLCSLVVETAIEQLPCSPVTVTTPLELPYQGLLQPQHICGVSIVRAGVAMELGLRRVCMDASIGKLLIQTDEMTGNPQLHFCRLPRNITQSHVLLMDASVATGAAAIMAIRVLLDHGVQEERIVFVTLIAALQGIHSIAFAFPKVNIVAAAVDASLNANFHIVPGFGNFGNRYFGTSPKTTT